MKITWYGHSSFLLETEKGTRILTDPYPQKVFAHPLVSCDLVTVSHEHYDHNDVAEVQPGFSVLRDAGRHLFRDVTVAGFPCWHDEVQGKKRGPNRIYLFEADGKRVVHMGDIGEPLSPELLEAVRGCDALLLPVGGVFTLSPADAARAAKEISPSYILPMHYSMPGHAFSIAPVEEFIAAMGPLPLTRLSSFAFDAPRGIVLFTPAKA